ncbi:hypothetical protein EYF80_039348 [Liparis tanakae]|uniref:Uncharacterized protein n=1 Tax=Liparis tanakae TaxID=230148 RepID=A0A4Z2GCR1_9TELE|nr:hypothetical protein EYF80_039348 [Liparis tanakae]
MEDGRQRHQGLAAQDPQHEPHQEARGGAVAVGHAAEEHADQLREHQDVGDFAAQHPEGDDALVQEDSHHQVDVPVAQQSHVRMVGLRPALVPFGFEGGPDADAEHQQVERDGGDETRHVESHAGSRRRITKSSDSTLVH